MLHKNTNCVFSVDSETGSYFLGDRELVTQGQIDAIINCEVNQRKCPNNPVVLDQFRLNFDAMRIIQTTADYFGNQSLQFM